MPATPDGPVLAFDVGTRRIGVAIGHPLGAGARALRTLASDDWSGLDALISDWQPQQFVVGLPLTLDGGEQPMSRRAREFARALEKRYARNVHLADERGSSQEAARRFARERASGAARRKDAAELDAVAAAVILDQWFASAQ
ncbi:MAG: Holliday junction resolvase RuvX [Dokdonella sp.]|uniref:Holliday junction resolvase RuvX n=1 Tax=Dokdonella sp. TaxID=2291710 RepID=UPI0025C68C65|nr:Holliday junction resolvase RuvX [Dokdonella sp.]MBX3701169.1 Holliday junction resolvase RuvX [Dokdonella sp.]MBZ0223757.1 Holliday junction resolvase RuvX [Dokdonella sp.]MCC7254304.1 Holliday junction resolvase RuvX [Dokdonella sp.]